MACIGVAGAKVNMTIKCNLFPLLGGLSPPVGIFLKAVALSSPLPLYEPRVDRAFGFKQIWVRIQTAPLNSSVTLNRFCPLSTPLFFATGIIIEHNCGSGTVQATRVTAVNKTDKILAFLECIF